MGIVLKDILAVVPKGTKNVIEKKNIYIQGDIIASVEKEPEGFQIDKVINGEDRLVIPGLINAHTHSYMSLFRNVADDLSFNDWLFGTIDPLEGKLLPEDAYWGAQLSILEMMRGGTTCFSDMQMHINQTTRAVAETGMRAVISRGLIGAGRDQAGSSRLAEAFEEMSNYKKNDMITFMLGPHAPYTCDNEFLKIVVEEAKKHQLGIHIHLSESKTEIDNMKKGHNCTPIEFAYNAGVFDVPTVAAHCVYATENDMEIMKEKQVSIVTNPASNMKLGNGFAPIPHMMEKGLNVCLGTDGAASNNSLNLFHELSLLTLIHKGVGETAQCISAQDGFKIATENGARALGMEDKIGKIKEGMKADLAILNLNNPSLAPRNNLVAGLCYSANGSEVETVIINGKITMENRKMLTMDEERIYMEIGRICRRLELDKKTY